MRRIILLLPTLLFVTGVLAACRPGEPRITVDTAQIDFGDVPNGQIAARDLVVRNEGDGLLVVDKIATSCGCTSASPSHTAGCQLRGSNAPAAARPCTQATSCVTVPTTASLASSRNRNIHSILRGFPRSEDYICDVGENFDRGRR